MPVDYQQIHFKIQQIGKGAGARQKSLDERRVRARDLLNEFSDQTDFLRLKLDAARAADPNIRCASPTDEALTASHPAPAGPPIATVIAADGSQINPDRHAAIQFGLVNVGAIAMQLSSAQAPQIFTESQLFHAEELLPNGVPMSDGLVALQRDLKEREKLDEISAGYAGEVIAISDGPIELWGAKGEDAQSYAQFVEKYLSVLSRMQARGVIVAGYVDKPSADLVVRLLEIGSAAPEDVTKLREFRPLQGVSDRWLFGERERPLLPPGHRSAVFGLPSGSDKKYSGVLALNFFYLNVGSLGHPWPVRVEVPQWVAENRQKLDLLHAALIEQCGMMGSRPYPYILHRAHETAVVKQDEKSQIEQMLAQELRRQGIEVDDISNKQSGKSLVGRNRR